MDQVSALALSGCLVSIAIVLGGFFIAAAMQNIANSLNTDRPIFPDNFIMRQEVKHIYEKRNVVEVDPTPIGLDIE